jgi:phosphate transport system permease protein
MSSIINSPELRPLGQTGGHVRARKLANVLMLTLCVLAAALAILLLGMVLYFLMTQGMHYLNWRLLTRVPNNVNYAQGGIAQAILGTMTLLSLASVIGLPFGILGGIYQMEARGHFAFFVRFFTDVLNGIPSIVIGIFAYAVVVLPTAKATGGSTSYTAYAGGFALGILMIPTVMRTTEEILRLVPFSLREASLGLGASRWRTMWSVVLPAARGGIITGIMLALARIAGETAPLLFTILGNVFFPTHRLGPLTVPSLNSPIDALPLTIYNYSQLPSPILNDYAWAGAIILIFMILFLSIAARFATRSGILEEK